MKKQQQKMLKLSNVYSPLKSIIEMDFKMLRKKCIKGGSQVALHHFLQSVQSHQSYVVKYHDAPEGVRRLQGNPLSWLNVL